MKKKKTYDRGRRKWKRNHISKGEQEISHVFKKIGYNVKNEFVINKLPFDIYIQELNLVIEYQGTRWHFDPRVYDADYYDRFTNQIAQDKWKKDAKKYSLAEENGYNVHVIWQNDWAKLANKRIYIEKLIKASGSVDHYE